jgi:hypothetical protein
MIKAPVHAGRKYASSTMGDTFFVIVATEKRQRKHFSENRGRLLHYHQGSLNLENCP